MHDVFLSPRTFPAKKEALPPKSKHSKGYWANSSKNLKNSGKAWEFPEKHGKYWKNMGNPEKSWEIPGMHGKSWERMGNPGKAWEILVKHWKSRDSKGNPGKHTKTRDILGKHRKS